MKITMVHQIEIVECPICLCLMHVSTFQFDAERCKEF